MGVVCANSIFSFSKKTELSIVPQIFFFIIMPREKNSKDDNVNRCGDQAEKQSRNPGGVSRSMEISTLQELATQTCSRLSTMFITRNQASGEKKEENKQTNKK